MKSSLKKITGTDLMVIPFMRVTGVRFRKTPTWFRKIRRKNGQVKHVSWFDHFGILKERPQVLVVEPYGSLTGRNLKELQFFCDEHDLEYLIFPTSAYSPTQTMHVRIWPRSLNAPDF
jgi:hypothetical protein